MQCKSPKSSQLTLFENENNCSDPSKSSTFVGNMTLPVHRWFRYSAGFSAMWVRETIRAAQAKGTVNVLDPFAGSGTVLVEAENEGVSSLGVESHPFVARIAEAKIRNGFNCDDLRDFGCQILSRAKKLRPSISRYPSLIRSCFPEGQLLQLDQLQKATLKFREEPLYELGWLCLASILRQCSPVGTANWQYVLPKKSKTKTSEPFVAFKAKIDQMCADVAARPHEFGSATLIRGDAREMTGVPDQWASLVITSPPYPNNFDYADATRLEMTFFGEIEGWGDLQESVRKYLVRACTQHVSSFVKSTPQILASKNLNPIREGIEQVCNRLEKERHSHGGKKNYHTMIALYFLDMAKVWCQLRRVTKNDCSVCFVIGDSAPYGIHVPVEKWMEKLAIAAGFQSASFEKIRDRNIKWKNRKHRIPLHEGRLWVRG
jgi:DNA modification methylase